MEWLIFSATMPKSKTQENKVFWATKLKVFENTFALETPINKVINLVYKEGFNYLPVVDKDKKVLRVITPSSLINFLRDK